MSTLADSASLGLTRLQPAARAERNSDRRSTHQGSVFDSTDNVSHTRPITPFTAEQTDSSHSPRTCRSRRASNASRVSVKARESEDWEPRSNSAFFSASMKSPCSADCRMSRPCPGKETRLKKVLRTPKHAERRRARSGSDARNVLIPERASAALLWASTASFDAVRAAASAISARSCALIESAREVHAITTVPSAAAADTNEIHNAADSMRRTLSGVTRSRGGPHRVHRTVRTEVAAIRRVECRGGSASEMIESVVGTFGGRVDAKDSAVINSQVSALERGVAAEEACEHRDVNVGAFTLRTVGTPFDVSCNKVVSGRHNTAEAAGCFGAPREESLAQRWLFDADACKSQTVAVPVENEVLLVGKSIELELELDAGGGECFSKQLNRERVEVALVDRAGAGECRMRPRLGEPRAQGHLVKSDGDVQRNVVDVEDTSVVVPLAGVVRSRRGSSRREHDAQTANRTVRIMGDSVAGSCLVHAIPTGYGSTVVALERCPNSAIPMSESRRSSLINPPCAHHARSIPTRVDRAISEAVTA